MDAIASKELEIIKQAILDTVNANKIYLFGSYAYGTPHKDSDFDIYVVIPDDSMRPIEAMQKIGSAISRKDIRAVDILVGKESAFNQRKQLPTLERMIFRDGVKIFEQDKYSKTMA
ncbi:MAG: nucleotidyltransferase domain-containing protein [Syntrophomonadaceae bacterium]|jgi:predicted nucleotidyltransferase|nr:nucleotidyltransferase domain-containing protein [Syntrophomonadaceae bacterium]MDD3898682.1 nucleotidyltransferase domain-containing protein [Syntrophomonadaceae bacterium]